MAISLTEREARKLLEFYFQRETYAANTYPLDSALVELKRIRQRIYEITAELETISEFDLDHEKHPVSR